MSEPTTAAGRALAGEHEWIVGSEEGDDYYLTRADFGERIVAIEAEAVADWLQSPEAEQRLATELLKDVDGYQETGYEQAAYDARAILAALQEKRDPR